MAANILPPCIVRPLTTIVLIMQYKWIPVVYKAVSTTFAITELSNDKPCKYDTMGLLPDT